MSGLNVQSADLTQAQVITTARTAAVGWTEVNRMSDLISRSDAIGAVKEERFPIDSDYAEGFMAALDKVEWILKEWLPSAQPDKDMIHLQKEQAYMQGWEEGRKALREEIWENERDRLD